MKTTNKKAILENELTKIAGVKVEATISKYLCISWEGENNNAFAKLQKYFEGRLFDYEFDKEIDLSVCYCNI